MLRTSRARSLPRCYQTGKFVHLVRGAVYLFLMKLQVDKARTIDWAGSTRLKFKMVTHSHAFQRGAKVLVGSEIHTPPFISSSHTTVTQTLTCRKNLSSWLGRLLQEAATNQVHRQDEQHEAQTGEPGGVNK